MKILFEEVNDIHELREKLRDNKDISNDYEVAVISCIFDKDDKIIFQRRGPACRDERFKLETIGGRVKVSDKDFRSALQREIVEEVGLDAKIAGLSIEWDNGADICPDELYNNSNGIKE